MVGDLFEVAAAAGHAAVIDVEDGKAVFGEELVEEEMLAAPAVAGGADTGTTVGVHDERNAVSRGIAWGQKDGAVELCDFIRRRELQGLRGDDLVALNRFGAPEGCADDAG